METPIEKREKLSKKMSIAGRFFTLPAFLTMTYEILNQPDQSLSLPLNSLPVKLAMGAFAIGGGLKIIAYMLRRPTQNTAGLEQKA